MHVHIPGQDPYQLHYLLLDFNGTIALDGKVLPIVKEKLAELSKLLQLYVITADSNGSASKECEGLPVTLHVIGKEDQREQKARFAQKLAPGVGAIGNGTNDERMFQEADLAIAVIGKEGCATASLMASDVVVTDITDALDLLLNHHRLYPTLRN